MRRELPPGRFRYESGSYGGPGRGYVPSIFSYKETAPDSWEEHFCLVRADTVLPDEDSAASIAEDDLTAARAVTDRGGGTPHDFALSLRHKGYKNVTDFRVVKDEPE